MVFAWTFIFLFGLVIGSFLNAVIYRLTLVQGPVLKIRDREFRVPTSPFRGRSFCPHCKHTLAWPELIPVLSFVVLGGKCRYCKKPISWQYPLVEISTGLLFVLILKFQLSSLNQVSSTEIFKLFYLLSIAAFLVVLFVYDLRHYILPDKVLFPAIGAVLGYRIFEVLSFGFAWDLRFRAWDFESLINPLLAGILAATFFLAIFLLSRGRAMGFGDVKLAFFMGLFLGWPNILVALFFAFTVGAVIGLILILQKKKGMKSEIPFGPFLITGTFIALLWGKTLVDWYLALILI